MIIFYSLLAGILGTLIGGLIAIYLGKADKSISLLMAFSAGIMVSIVFLELIPESLEMGNVVMLMLGLVAGFILTVLIDMVSDSFLNQDEGKNSFKVASLIVFAIALHNIPEGFAVGASANYTLALAIGIHNIPLGIAIASTLKRQNIKNIIVIVFVVLSGSTTVLGTAIGYLASSIPDFALSFILAFSSGALVYIIFGELLSPMFTTRKNFFLSFLVLGMLVGILI